MLNAVATLHFVRDGRQCFLTPAREMIHFSVLRVEAPQVFEDECEVSFLFLLANTVGSTDTAFAKSSGYMRLPRRIRYDPVPFAVPFDFSINLHSAAPRIIIS